MKASDHSGHRRKLALGILAEARHRGHRLVRALLSASRPGIAELAARALLRLRPSDDTLLHVLAALAWARGDTVGAAEAAATALAADPSVARHRWLLASIRQSRGEPDRAIAILGPERPGREPLRNLCLRASLHLQRGDLATAARLARIAHDRFPRKPEPLRLLISAGMESGDFESASALAELAGTTCPENAGLLHLRATVSERLGDIASAQRALERCLELRPDRLAARLALVRILTLQGQGAAAQRLARAAAEDAAALGSRERHLAAEIFDMAQIEPPADLVAAIACQPCTNADEALWALWASIARHDRTELLRAYEAALRLVERDGRLLALLSGIGDTIDADARSRGLPPPSLLVPKLKAQALSEVAQDPALAEADRLVGNLLRRAAAQDQDEPAVSFICPIHRARDIPNLLAQLGGQIWRRAEVIFCINGDGINAGDLVIAPEKGFRARHLVLPAGRTLGHYLNRAIAAATGDIIIRIDADDIYAPDYTRVMVRFLRDTGAEIVSINPYCFYFADLDQTYLIRSPGSPVARDVATGNRQAVGSGSSVCARRDVFARLAFDEDLALGEDVTFYRRALAAGFRICTLPGHFHTATRSADKTAHTWRPDDARLLSRESRFLGDGCIVMRPGAQTGAEPARDPFAGLLDDEAFAPFQELRIEDALRSVRQPLHILRGPETPIPDRNSTALIVGGPGSPAPARGAMALAVAPENPVLEEAIARRHGALSFTIDVLPRLACGDREAFARLGGIARGDRRGFVRRFDAAGLRYAILTNPRCGSEHLCALLASLGLGSPREHVRTPVAALLGRDAQHDAFLRTLFGQIERDGVVGTKLVTQFLFDGDVGPAAERLLAWMVDAGFRFVRLTRAPTESAVSAYVAEQRGVWHVREREHAAFGTSALPDEEGPPPPYDFHAIAREMERHVDWTSRLDALCDDLIPAGSWVGIDYTEILRDTQSAVAQISDFLGFAPPPGALATSPLVASSRGAAQTRSFRTRFAAEWAVDDRITSTLSVPIARLATRP